MANTLKHRVFRESHAQSLLVAGNAVALFTAALVVRAPLPFRSAPPRPPALRGPAHTNAMSHTSTAVAVKT